MRVLYFGTYERDYPRNAQVISALRRAAVEVAEHHVSVWEGRRDNWQAGATTAARLGIAELRLLRRPDDEFDALLVGYPGHLDLTAARRVAAGRPVVFNPLVSLYDTFVADRGRFTPSSAMARVLRSIDRQALRAADVVVADLSVHNANVFYELGIRHALRDHGTFMLRCDADKFPFDLQTDRYFVYKKEDPGA